ncbi:thioredoxin [Stigmatella sp. ncwal1]|uniref:Thioredoxin n=1 Tax=Stigmatella ashevillensis TaxID=2995309 RepID=A0ABT5DJ46_9BACT|nr:thioredoxin [Stigmatella ashevillena]MDC0712818.1 thioredoxin [Stigmatella ashevillena]
MATVEISKEIFKDTVGKEGIVLLDWWAEWCGPCRNFGPIYEQVSNKHADLTFGKIDTEAQPELAGAFEIRSIPTLMVFRDGILLFEQAGALPAAALEDLISKVRALDMDDVRKQVAAQRAAAETPKA